MLACACMKGWRLHFHLTHPYGTSTHKDHKRSWVIKTYETCSSHEYDVMSSRSAFKQDVLNSASMCGICRCIKAGHPRMEDLFGWCISVINTNRFFVVLTPTLRFTSNLILTLRPTEVSICTTLRSKVYLSLRLLTPHHTTSTLVSLLCPPPSDSSLPTAHTDPPAVPATPPRPSAAPPQTSRNRPCP